MAGMARNGKKGISLAYVIVAAMVLLILSGVLASAAVRNMSLTAVSTGERQAYLTVKSAVEYAKGEAYREEKAGGLAGFSVAPGGDPFRTVAAADPDGKEIYARCTVKDGLVTVSGRVAYGDSGRYRSLGCSFRLTEEEEPESGIGAVNCYVAAGGAYGGNKFMNGENQFAPSGRSDYPVLLKKSIRVSGSSNSLEAPDVFFLGGRDGGASLDFSDSSAELSIKADFVYITGAVSGAKDGGNQTKRSQFRLSGKRDNGDRDDFIYVWFDDATINLKNVGTKTLNGLYRFPESGADLFDFASYPPETDGKDWDLYGYYSDMVSYFSSECTNLLSGESQNGGIGWTTDGKLSKTPAPKPGADVFLYVDSGLYNDNYTSYGSPITYEARGIVLQYKGTEDNPFTVPKTTITFLADTLWLNGQSEDGAPGDDSDDDDVLAVKQGSSVSRFVLKSHGGGPVTVYLPHGLAVKNAAGAELYSVSAGTYSVESGTDLFAANADAFTELPSGGGGSGGGSGEGGVTVSELKYTDS